MSEQLSVLDLFNQYERYKESEYDHDSVVIDEIPPNVLTLEEFEELEYDSILELIRKIDISDCDAEEDCKAVWIDYLPSREVFVLTRKEWDHIYSNEDTRAERFRALILSTHPEYTSINTINDYLVDWYDIPEDQEEIDIVFSLDKWMKYPEDKETLSFKKVMDDLALETLAKEYLFNNTELTEEEHNTDPLSALTSLKQRKELEERKMSEDMKITEETRVAFKLNPAIGASSDHLVEIDQMVLPPYIQKAASLPDTFSYLNPYMQDFYKCIQTAQGPYEIVHSREVDFLTPSGDGKLYQPKFEVDGVKFSNLSKSMLDALNARNNRTSLSLSKPDTASNVVSLPVDDYSDEDAVFHLDITQPISSITAINIWGSIYSLVTSTNEDSLGYVATVRDNEKIYEAPIFKILPLIQYLMETDRDITSMTVPEVFLQLAIEGRSTFIPEWGPIDDTTKKLISFMNGEIGYSLHNALRSIVGHDRDIPSEQELRRAFISRNLLPITPISVSNLDKVAASEVANNGYHFVAIMPDGSDSLSDAIAFVSYEELAAIQNTKALGAIKSGDNVDAAINTTISVMEEHNPPKLIKVDTKKSPAIDMEYTGIPLKLLKDLKKSNTTDTKHTAVKESISMSPGMSTPKHTIYSNTEQQSYGTTPPSLLKPQTRKMVSIAEAAQNCIDNIKDQIIIGHPPKDIEKIGIATPDRATYVLRNIDGTYCEIEADVSNESVIVITPDAQVLLMSPTAAYKYMEELMSGNYTISPQYIESTWSDPKTIGIDDNTVRMWKHNLRQYKLDQERVRKTMRVNARLKPTDIDPISKLGEDISQYMTGNKANQFAGTMFTNQQTQTQNNSGYNQNTEPDYDGPNKYAHNINMNTAGQAKYGSNNTMFGNTNHRNNNQNTKQWNNSHMTTLPSGGKVPSYMASMGRPGLSGNPIGNQQGFDRFGMANQMPNVNRFNAEINSAYQQQVPNMGYHPQQRGFGQQQYVHNPYGHPAYQQQQYQQHQQQYMTQQMPPNTQMGHGYYQGYGHPTPMGNVMYPNMPRQNNGIHSNIPGRNNAFMTNPGGYYNNPFGY